MLLQVRDRAGAPAWAAVIVGAWARALVPTEPGIYLGRQTICEARDCAHAALRAVAHRAC